MPVGHECHLCGHHLEYQFGKRIDGIAFDVKLCGHPWTNVAHILIAYVALVGTGMNGNAFCTKCFGVKSHCQHVGVVSSAGVAESGNFIDIYTQSCHIFHFSLFTFHFYLYLCIGKDTKSLRINSKNAQKYDFT